MQLFENNIICFHNDNNNDLLIVSFFCFVNEKLFHIFIIIEIMCLASSDGFAKYIGAKDSPLEFDF